MNDLRSCLGLIAVVAMLTAWCGDQNATVSVGVIGPATPEFVADRFVDPPSALPCRRRVLAATGAPDLRVEEYGDEAFGRYVVRTNDVHDGGDTADGAPAGRADRWDPTHRAFGEPCRDRDSVVGLGHE